MVNLNQEWKRDMRNILLASFKSFCVTTNPICTFYNVQYMCSPVYLWIQRVSETLNLDIFTSSAHV